MNIRIPKLVLSLGALALAALALTFAVPQKARAVASALVQLTNTLANPGVTQDVSKQAGQMVALTCPAVPSADIATCYLNGAPTAVYVTPANQSLVITTVDITGNSAATWQAVLYVPGGATLTDLIGSGGNTSHFDYPQGLVVPPNQQVAAYNQSVTASPTVALHGYLTFQ